MSGAGGVKARERTDLFSEKEILSGMSDRTPFTYILVLPNSSSERKGGKDKMKWTG